MTSFSSIWRGIGSCDDVILGLDVVFVDHVPWHSWLRDWRVGFGALARGKDDCLPYNDYSRFLWFSDPTDPESDFMTYRFRSVLFGSASSPFMLNAVLQTHLDNHKTPVTQDMKENLYVDNVITGCNTDTEALRYYQESRSVMAEAKFNLQSWASNSPLLQNQAATDRVLDTDSGTTNILGLQWDSAADTLTLTSKEVQLPQDTITTKREILRESSKIYDPLGLITPVSI